MRAHCCAPCPTPDGAASGTLDLVSASSLLTLVDTEQLSYDGQGDDTSLRVVGDGDCPTSLVREAGPMITVTLSPQGQGRVRLGVLTLAGLTVRALAADIVGRRIDLSDA